MLSPLLHQQLESARAQGAKIILVTGVFDLFHEEHRHFLQLAKAEGDFLIVGIESDVRVRQLKGPGRPIQNQDTRQQQLIESGIPDAVFILPDDFSKPEHHEALIAEVRPALLAVSSHTPHQDKKRRILALYGADLKVVLAENPEVSTTKLIEEQKGTKTN